MSAPTSRVNDHRVELTMVTAEPASATGFLTIPRAVLSVAAEVYSSVERVVVGDSRVRTARSNAWEAMCADQARNRHRDETRRLVAELVRSEAARIVAASTLTAQVSVRSSPRSSASHASLVSTGPAARG
jgi:hypothetical protein